MDTNTSVSEEMLQKYDLVARQDIHSRRGTEEEGIRTRAVLGDVGHWHGGTNVCLCAIVSNVLPGDWVRWNDERR